MISSLIGSVIMSAVSVALLIAIDFTDKTLLKVGKHPLTNEEREILINAGLKSEIENLNQEIKLLKFNE